MHICISRRGGSKRARVRGAGGKDDEDGDENSEKTRQKESGVTRVEVE